MLNWSVKFWNNFLLLAHYVKLFLFTADVFGNEMLKIENLNIYTNVLRKGKIVNHMRFVSLSSRCFFWRVNIFIYKYIFSLHGGKVDSRNLSKSVLGAKIKNMNGARDVASCRRSVLINNLIFSVVFGLFYCF